MLLERSARPLGILVEEQQALRQLAVIKPFRLQHVGNDGLVAAFSQKRGDVFAFILKAGIVKLAVEGETLDVVEVTLLKVGLGRIVVAVQESEHVLEHAAGSSAGRNELDNALAFGLVGVPRVDISCTLIVGRSHDAVAHGCGGLEPHDGVALIELAELCLDLSLGDAFFGNLP